MPRPAPDDDRRLRGFERAGKVLRKRIQEVGEGRGFAVSRLLTHWAEIAGEDIAAVARPVRVRYGQAGSGATLTLLVAGAEAPVVQMQTERIRERVNACYGYGAIRRILITQTSPDGLAGGLPERAPRDAPAPPPDPRAREEAGRAAAQVRDGALRRALATLGENILSRRDPT